MADEDFFCVSIRAAGRYQDSVRHACQAGDRFLIGKASSKTLREPREGYKAVIPVNGSRASRLHAEIVFEEGRLWIQDIDSTNGTWFNGARIRPNERYPLRTADAIYFGGPAGEKEAGALRLVHAPEPASLPQAEASKKRGSLTATAPVTEADGGCLQLELQRHDDASIETLTLYLGHSNSMRAAILEADDLAHTDHCVVILGETGTGKTLLAKAIHTLSPRFSGPFVAVNCGAIPESMAASELFGHVKGAFTGAVKNHKGYFEQARSGTLFLDEVGELTPLLQTQLLKAIEDRRVTPVGGERAVQVDARLILATNRDLEVEVAEGRFREDLLNRLKGGVIVLPSLTRRQEEDERHIESLAARTVRASPEWRGGEGPVFDPEASELLRRHPWQGNVRELNNVLALLLRPSFEDRYRRIWSQGLNLQGEPRTSGPFTRRELDAALLGLDASIQRSREPEPSAAVDPALTRASAEIRKALGDELLRSAARFAEHSLRAQDKIAEYCRQRGAETKLSDFIHRLWFASFLAAKKDQGQVSNEKLARALGVNRSTITKYRNELRQLGLLDEA